MKTNRGFTLIELLVVIAIIGLLSSIVAASLQQSRIKGKDAAKIEAFHQVEIALEEYYQDHGAYPTVTQTPTFSYATTFDVGEWDQLGTLLAPYLQEEVSDAHRSLPAGPDPAEAGAARCFSRSAGGRSGKPARRRRSR